MYNLIIRNPVTGDSIEGYQVYRKENAERAFIQGAETAWQFRMTPSWLISGSLTYTYGQNKTKNEPVRRIPPLFGRMAVEGNIKGFRVGMECLAAGKQERLAKGDMDDNRIPLGGTPGWEIINLNSGYNIRFITIDLTLQNIFNQDYRYHGSGINGYGRSVFLTVMFSFR